MATKHPSIPPTHPGAYLREIVLPDMDMTKAGMARALGISRQTLYDILNEKQPVTVDMALRLGRFFGTSPESWLNMQNRYDFEKARQRIDLQAIPVYEPAAG